MKLLFSIYFQTSLIALLILWYTGNTTLTLLFSAVYGAVVFAITHPAGWISAEVLWYGQVTNIFFFLHQEPFRVLVKLYCTVVLLLLFVELLEGKYIWTRNISNSLISGRQHSYDRGWQTDPGHLQLPPGSHWSALGHHSLPSHRRIIGQDLHFDPGQL